jgi:hypothetical protein
MYYITQLDIKEIIELLNKAIKYEEWDQVEEAKEYLEEFVTNDKEEYRTE